MLTGRTSVYIDTVKSDDDPPQQPDVEMESSGSEDEVQDESLRLQGIEKKKKLDRTKFGKHIINFGMFDYHYIY